MKKPVHSASAIASLDERFQSSEKPLVDVPKVGSFREFLEKFGRPEEVAFEISVPGWTAELVEDLTRSYLEDVERIARIPGVRLVEP